MLRSHACDEMKRMDSPPREPVAPDKQQAPIERKGRPMKLTTLMITLLVSGFIGSTTLQATAEEAGEADKSEKAEQAELEAQAKITKADAEKIALGKAPGGTVKEAELEMENGKLVWSFDFTTPGTKNITEVLVDAKTGAVVSVEKESAEDEAKEKSEEHHKDKDDQDRDDDKE
jgi:uncharacterized membrane protein YkoI